MAEESSTYKLILRKAEYGSNNSILYFYYSLYALMLRIGINVRYILSLEFMKTFLTDFSR